MRTSEGRMNQKALLRIMLRAYKMGQKNQNMELREIIQDMSLQLKIFLEQEKRMREQSVEIREEAARR